MRKILPFLLIGLVSGALAATGPDTSIGETVGDRSGTTQENTTADVIIGANVGGGAGAGINRYMDRVVSELKRNLKNAFVERVGEGINVTFNSSILFEKDSTLVRNSGKTSLDRLGKTLKRYEDTVVLIEDHVDSTGETLFNQEMSKDRAKSVADYLEARGVKGERLRPVGKGEETPVADNATPAGQRANRRVEVVIVANEKLKKAAESGEIKIPS